MFDKDKLMEWRTSRGLTRTQMGKIVGVSESTIYAWELGHYKPRPETEAQLNRAMERYEAKPIRKEKSWFEMRKACEGCIYLGDLSKTCDYYLITGTRRPCPSGEGCTVKHVGEKGLTRPFEMRAPATRFHRMVPATERDPRVRELYEAGKNDAEISLETGYSVNSVYNWRRRHNYPTNYTHNKGIKTGKQKRTEGEK